jgi:hypothetical protein
MVVEIALSKYGRSNKGKYITIVDDEDGDLAEFNWSTSGNATYAERNNQGKVEKLHRVIVERMIAPLKLRSGEQVDHINMNTLDNRRKNLRVVSHSQNNMNRRRQSNDTTGYKGVSWDRTKKRFMVQIRKDKKKYHLGYFNTVEEAYAAYCEKAKELHGEFVRLE